MKIFGRSLNKPFLTRGGSLSLSINAIVVLILAIAMLGLGLGFTKSMFAKLKGSIEIPEPENPATVDQPLVFNKDTIVGKANEGLGFTVNVFNPTKTEVTTGVTITDCQGKMSTPSGVSSPNQKIPSGEYRTFKIVLSKTNVGESTGLTVCTVDVTDTTFQKVGISRQISFDIAG